MLRIPLALLAATMTLALVAATHEGDPCLSRGQPALGIVELTGGSAERSVYVDDRNSIAGNDLWIYAESNGLWWPKAPGPYANAEADRDLQRGGCSVTGHMVMCEGGVDYCVDDPNVLTDMLVF